MVFDNTHVRVWVYVFASLISVNRNIPCDRLFKDIMKKLTYATNATPRYAPKHSPKKYAPKVRPQTFPTNTFQKRPEISPQGYMCVIQG